MGNLKISAVTWKGTLTFHRDEATDRSTFLLGVAEVPKGPTCTEKKSSSNHTLQPDLHLGQGIDIGVSLESETWLVSCPGILKFRSVSSMLLCARVPVLD